LTISASYRNIFVHKSNRFKYCADGEKYLLFTVASESGMVEAG